MSLSCVMLARNSNYVITGILASCYCQSMHEDSDTCATQVVDDRRSSDVYITATLAPSVRSVPPGYFKGAYHCSPGQRVIGDKSSNDGPRWWSWSLWFVSVGGRQAAALMSGRAAAVGCRELLRRTQATHHWTCLEVGTLTAPFDPKE